MFRVSVSRCEYNESRPDSYPQACPYVLYKKLSQGDKLLQTRILHTSTKNRLKIIAWLKVAFKTDVDKLLEYCYIFREKAKIFQKQDKWTHDYTNDLRPSKDQSDMMSWIISGTRKFNLDHVESRIKDLFTKIFKNLNISGKAAVREFFENCFDSYNFSDPSWSMVNNIIRSILDMYESDLDVAKVLKEIGSFTEFEDNTWNLSSISIACVNHHHTDWTELYNCPFQHFLENDIKCLSLFPCLISHEEKFFLDKYDLNHNNTLTFEKEENLNIKIGRSRDNPICLLYQPYVHRFHSTISYKDGQLFLKDINESNSIWIKEPYSQNEEIDEQGAQIERNCLICMTNPRKIICKPCWHWTTCEECHAKVKNNKCLVCKQPYDYTSIMDLDDDERSMQTMVPNHLRQHFHGRRHTFNLGKEYFKEMGFRPVSNGGEFIKQKGTEIAVISNQYSMKVDINILEEKVTNLVVNSSIEELQKNIPVEDLPKEEEEFSDEELKTLYALFQIITSIFSLIKFSDVKTAFEKFDYNVHRTFKMFNVNKNSIVEIITISFDELQL